MSGIRPRLRAGIYDVVEVFACRGLCASRPPYGRIRAAHSPIARFNDPALPSTEGRERDAQVAKHLDKLGTDGASGMRRAWKPRKENS